MKKSLPKLSYVIPVRNRAHIIGEALESLKVQTMPDWEAIVVDDSSTDDIDQAIRTQNDDRIKLVSLPRARGGGVSSARNYGNLWASAPLIAVLDSDDLALPQRSQITLDSYNEHHWDMFSAGRITRDMVTGQEKLRPIVPTKWDPELFKQTTYVTHSSMAYTKKTAMDFPYNSAILVDDYDFITRLIEHGAFIWFDPQILVIWRRFEVSQSTMFASTIRPGYIQLIRSWRGWPHEPANVEELERENRRS